MTSPSKTTLFPFGLPVAALTAVLAACSPAPSADASSSNPARDIRDLVAALTPPPLTAVPVEKSAYFQNRKRTLQRLRESGRAQGLEALRVYREEPPSLPAIRAGLLDVAAHTAPEACADLLVELATTFGEDISVRTEATLILGECVPERAIEVLGPILRDRYDGRTYPPEDRMLQAWITGCEKTGKDPVPLLMRIATDLERPMDVRHLATKSLGEHPSPESRQALRTLLVESSGNGYIRRLALQSLHTILPKDEFCTLAREVQSREADTEFIVFLEDAIVSNCR